MVRAETVVVRTIGAACDSRDDYYYGTAAVRCLENCRFANRVFECQPHVRGFQLACFECWADDCEVRTCHGQSRSASGQIKLNRRRRACWEDSLSHYLTRIYVIHSNRSQINRIAMTIDADSRLVERTGGMGLTLRRPYLFSFGTLLDGWPCRNKLRSRFRPHVLPSHGKGLSWPPLQ
jgi:hypothetical protein